MTIRPGAASRLVYALAGTGAALCFLGLAVPLILRGDPFAIFGVLMAGILGLIAYYGARGSVLRADETSVVYRPAIGASRAFARSRLASIDRVFGLKGVARLSFRSRDGGELFEAGETYRQADIEALALHLGVPLRW